MAEVNTSSKRRGTEEDLGVEDHKKSRVERGEEEEEQREEDKEEEEEEQRAESEGWGVFKADGVEIRVKLKEMLETEQEEDTEGEDDVNVERFFIGECLVSL